MTNLEILVRARELIADPRSWLQGRWRERRGTLWRRDAYCLDGALAKAASDDPRHLDTRAHRIACDLSWRYLRGTSGSIISFNDHHTHAEVLALARSASDLCAARSRRAQAVEAPGASAAGRGRVPMTQPGESVLIDLFCGAGGATKGYQRAGFYVIGVDIDSQPHYCGDEFIQADALTVDLARADAVHASPPCQFGSSLRNLHKPRGYFNLIAPTRERLLEAGVPFAIENVEGARRHLRNPLMLCGSGFGLDVRRHRYFECHGFHAMSPGCAHGQQARRFRSLDSRKGLSSVVSVHGEGRMLASVVGVHGSLNYAGERALREAAMGIDWMSTAELSQAIPPAYTEHLGGYLLRSLEALDVA